MKLFAAGAIAIAPQTSSAAHQRTSRISLAAALFCLRGASTWCRLAQLAGWLVGFPPTLQPSSPPALQPSTVDNIGADMARCTSPKGVTSGENPGQCGRSSNSPDLATKRHPWSLWWLVGGGLSTRRTAVLIGHGVFQVLDQKPVSSDVTNLPR